MIHEGFMKHQFHLYQRSELIRSLPTGVPAAAEIPADDRAKSLDYAEDEQQ